MIIYWVWRSNINIPLAWVCSEAPPSKYYLWPGNKWAEVAQNEGWFRNRGTHSGLVNDGDCGGRGGNTPYMHCTLYWAGSVTTNVHTSLTMTLETNMGLYWFGRYCQYYTHETWRMLRYSAINIAALCRGHIVFHDTSFVSILISDTDLIIRRAQMESVIGSSNINSGLDCGVQTVPIWRLHRNICLPASSQCVKRMMEKPRYVTF